MSEQKRRSFGIQLRGVWTSETRNVLVDAASEEEAKAIATAAYQGFEIVSIQDQKRIGTPVVAIRAYLEGFKAGVAGEAPEWTDEDLPENHIVDNDEDEEWDDEDDDE